MHGDLCFNNILYDLYSGTIRLIDARGSYGSKHTGIYGDQGYDIAKICHSGIGGYDYIVNGLFTFEENESGYSYKILFGENHEKVVEQNIDLLSYFGYTLNEMSYFMSLLFLSMTPLHNDNQERQKVFYLHGTKLLNEALESEGLIWEL